MLKAYLVHDGTPDELAALVFAPTGQAARHLGHGWENIGAEGFLTVKASRRPDLDYLAQDRPAAYVESATAILRQAGWHCEGDASCGACGLYELDGAVVVCTECDQCADCGHADDCPERPAPADAVPCHPALPAPAR